MRKHLRLESLPRVALLALLALTCAACAGTAPSAARAPVVSAVTGVSLTPLPTPYTAYQWVPVNLPLTDYAIADIVMLSADQGWAVGRQGDKGLILRYVAGDWQVARDDIPVPLMAVSALDAEHAWAIGGCGRQITFLRFDGHAWLAETVPEYLTLEDNGCQFGLDFISPAEGWVIDYSGRRLIQINAGRWQPELDSPGALLDQRIGVVDMVSATEGWGLESEWYVTSTAPIWHYAAGIWSPEPAVAGVRLSDLRMISDQAGWAVGRDGVVLRYRNGVWSRVPTPTTQSLAEICAATADSLCVNGWDQVLWYSEGEWQMHPMHHETRSATTAEALVIDASDTGWAGSSTGLHQIVSAPSFLLPTPTPMPPHGDIAYLEPSGGIALVSADGKNRRLIFDGRGFTIRRIAWLPDGAHLSFAAFYDAAGLGDWYDIFVLDVKAGSLKDTQIDAYAAGHDWSPDGQRLVFATRDGLALQNLVTGGREALTDQGQDRDPLWSPLGDEIAFVRQDDLWTISLDTAARTPNQRHFYQSAGGELTPLWPPLGGFVEGTQQAARWSNDGWLVAAQPEGIVIAGLNTENPIALGSWPVWRPVNWD